MNPCDEYAVRSIQHLDDDLKEKELEDFQSHLASCPNCRAYLEAEKALSQILHHARPLYSAPAALRDRVATAVIQHAAPDRDQGRVDQRLHRIFGERLSGSRQLLVSWRVLTPAALAIFLCLAVVPDIERRVQAASYVETAVASHRSYVNGGLRPRLESSSPEEIAAWFAGKVPFDFRLPAAESAPDQNLVYRLTGANLVHYKGGPAALVTYATQNDKISLLVDSSKSALVAGGVEIRFGKLTFHYYNNSGFRVITWSNHGLSYALVSSVSGPARASCLVCHQNMTDKAAFQARP